MFTSKTLLVEQTKHCLANQGIIYTLIKGRHTSYVSLKVHGNENPTMRNQNAIFN